MLERVSNLHLRELALKDRIFPVSQTKQPGRELVNFATSQRTACGPFHDLICYADLSLSQRACDCETSSRLTDKFADFEDESSIKPDIIIRVPPTRTPVDVESGHSATK